MAIPDLIAPGVYRVDALRIPNAISVLLVRSDHGWTLVDTGLGLSVGRIQSAMAALNGGPHDLIRIVVTHHHPDHIGGLPGLLAWAPAAEVWASTGEAGIISGTRPPDQPSGPIVRRLVATRKLPTAPVARTLAEGDTVAGFRVIDTPGHTLGHISLLRDDGLLFTADAFANLPPRVSVGGLDALCSDPRLARVSADKLLREDFETVVFTHGPVRRAGAKAALREAVERSRS
jgi:glyoxylase-like metal-dependent hydrolase (beta-lactamase superfamily II)